MLRVVRSIFVLFLVCCLVADRSAFAEETDDQSAVQLESLRKVWQTIHDVHWDRELIAEKWEGILPEFEAKIASAEDADGAREAMQSMIKRLGQSHFSIIPKAVYDRQEELGIRKGNGTLGLQIRHIDDELIVTGVRDGSPADVAGIGVGDRVDGIGKRSAKKIIKRAAELAEFEAGRKVTFVGLIAEAMLRGTVGEDITVQWTDHEDKQNEASIKLAESEGDFAKFGNMPAVEIVMSSEVLPGDFIHYRFSSFFNPLPLIIEMKKLMEDHSDAKGLILDVRGNRGGIVVMVPGLSNWLSPEATTIGIMKRSDSELKLKLNPRKPTFKGKVVVLIDELSISSAEILAGGLQDASIATVIGTTSAGLVLPSMISTLPNGDRFQYAISDFQTGSGRRLEGDGVTPDVVVNPTRASLQQLGDPILTRAIEWLKEK